MKKSYLFRKQMRLAMSSLWIEIAVRIALVVTFVSMERLQPFERKIHPEEMWLYKNPMTASYVPASMLWPVVVLVPTAVILGVFFIKRETVDCIQAALAASLGLGLNGLITDIGKLVVGRPRPDFFWRCFPDGHSNPEMHCTGDPAVITEGRKSFPSGHSSFSFASLGFVSIYLAGKLGIFHAKGRGQSHRFLAVVLPLLAALAIALSRTSDYHHHWQDVLCGSILGLFVAYVSYRQYYPPLDSPQSDLPLVQVTIPAVNYDDSTSARELPYKVV